MSAPIVVERRIAAPPSVVYTYLTESDRWARWQGVEATIDAIPGGLFAVSMANGMRARGQFLSLSPIAASCSPGDGSTTQAFRPAPVPSRSISSRMTMARCSPSPTVICRPRKWPYTLEAGTTTCPAWHGYRRAVNLAQTRAWANRDQAS